jgi:hypothetical protein
VSEIPNESCYKVYFSHIVVATMDAVVAKSFATAGLYPLDFQKVCKNNYLCKNP